MRLASCECGWGAGPEDQRTYGECDEGREHKNEGQRQGSSRLEHTACGCALMIFDGCTATIEVRAPCAGNFRTRVLGNSSGVPPIHTLVLSCRLYPLPINDSWMSLSRTLARIPLWWLCDMLQSHACHRLTTTRKCASCGLTTPIASCKSPFSPLVVFVLRREATTGY